MSTQRYSVTPHPVETLLTWVKSGEIAIPEIQRPFVWEASKVRNLLDSLYRGYPVGYLISWKNPTVRLKDGTPAAGKRILIDGQQRVTALMASLLGREVLTKDYETVRIRIAFNPLEEKFEVANPAIQKDAAWLPDIAAVFSPDAKLLQLTKAYTAGFWRLYTDDFNNIRLPVPPPDEQAAIVRFLDHADRRIRRYISAKRKLIALLNEQKQAIIHKAVTRGLDPNVKLKPSGVEWLGEVPEHWDVVRLKEVTTRIEQGWSPQCDSQQAAEYEWGVLKVGCVNGDAFAGNKNKKLPDNLQPLPALEISDGDILVSRANTRELLGLAVLCEKPRSKLMLCDKLFRFHAKGDRANGKFLVVAIRSRPSRAQIESRTNGASDSMQNIGQDVLRNLVVTLPPMPEQDAIVARLTMEASGLICAVRRAEDQVALLREYRTRLIADVVTGKLDVRGAAAKLPVDAPDQEPLDVEPEADGEELDEGETETEVAEAEA